MKKSLLALIFIFAVFTLVSCVSENIKIDLPTSFDESFAESAFIDESESIIKSDAPAVVRFESISAFAEFKSMANKTEEEVEAFLANHSFNVNGVTDKKALQNVIKIIGNASIPYILPESGYTLAEIKFSQNNGQLVFNYGNENANRVRIVVYFTNNASPDLSDGSNVMTTFTVNSVTADVYQVESAEAVFGYYSFYSSETNLSKLMFDCNNQSEIHSLMNEYGVITTLNELVGE